MKDKQLLMAMMATVQNPVWNLKLRDATHHHGKKEGMRLLKSVERTRMRKKLSWIAQRKMTTWSQNK